MIEVEAPGSNYSNDTTGCGDVFSAAVIAGKIKQLFGEELFKFAVNSATLVANNGFLPQNIIASWENGFHF